jgi:hypothetical protein
MHALDWAELYVGSGGGVSTLPLSLSAVLRFMLTRPQVSGGPEHDQPAGLAGRASQGLWGPSGPAVEGGAMPSCLCESPAARCSCVPEADQRLSCGY